MKHLEIKTVEHKEIKVAIKIDYDEGTAALVTKDNMGRYNDKHFVFSGRGLEYMNGWLDILEAMIGAVKECKKELETNLAEKSKFAENKIINLAKLSKKKQ